MKALGLVLKIVAGVIAIVAIALTVILMTVDPNDYKPEITQAVKDSTGRDIQIDNMSLSVFPQLSIDLEQTQMSNAKGFSETPFFTAEKVQVGAAILPLLSKELQVEALTLHGLKINLEKNAEGITNWDDLVKADESKQDYKTDDQANDKGNPLEKLSSLNFGGIDIKDGLVSWKDQQNQQNIELSGLNVNTTAITFGEFFTLNVSAKAKVSNPEIASDLQLSFDAKLDQDGSYAIKNLAVNNQTSGAGIPVEKATTSIQLDTFSLAENQLSIPLINLSYDVVGGKDFASINGKLDITDLSGDLTAQAFVINKLALNTTASGETIPSGKADVALQTPVQINLTEQTALLKELSLKAMGLQLDASVNATSIIDNPKVTTTLNIAETDLKALMQKLKVTLPEMANKQAMQKFAASMNIDFQQKQQALKLSKLNIQLDQTTLSGSASVANFAKPAVRYDLAVNKINVSDYLPPKAEKPAPSKEAPPSTDEKIEIPTQMLRDLDVKGTVKVGDLTFDKLNPKNIVLTTNAKGGNIQLNPIKADIFNTRINAQAGLNVSTEKPKYNFKTDTKNLPIGEVLKAFTGKDFVTGSGLVKVDVTTSGERISEFKQTLNGSVIANLENGAVKGFNLAKAIRNAKAKMAGKPATNSSTEEQTDFSELKLNAAIKNGVVNTKTLSAKAPFMRINGSGTINLPKESLDYLVKTKIVASDKGQGGEELKELNGLTIPVKLKGSYLDPSISLDLGSLLEQKAKAELENKKDNAVKDIKKKAEDKLKDSLFKGLKF